MSFECGWRHRGHCRAGWHSCRVSWFVLNLEARVVMLASIVDGIFPGVCAWGLRIPKGMRSGSYWMFPISSILERSRLWLIEFCQSVVMCFHCLDVWLLAEDGGVVMAPMC